MQTKQSLIPTSHALATRNPETQEPAAETRVHQSIFGTALYSTPEVHPPFAKGQKYSSHAPRNHNSTSPTAHDAPPRKSPPPNP